MNNEVTFSIKIIDEGSESMKRVTANIAELGRIRDTVTEKSSRMNGKLLIVNHASHR